MCVRVNIYVNVYILTDIIRASVYVSVYILSDMICACVYLIPYNIAYILSDMICACVYLIPYNIASADGVPLQGNDTPSADRAPCTNILYINVYTLHVYVHTNTHMCIFRILYNRVK